MTFFTWLGVYIAIGIIGLVVVFFLDTKNKIEIDAFYMLLATPLIFLWPLALLGWVLKHIGVMR